MYDRYLFGVNAELKNNLHLCANDTKLVYVAGHNVVVTRLEDRQQHFFAGTADAECITAVCMSDDGNYLAICQRGISQGSFIVYQVDK